MVSGSDLLLPILVTCNFSFSTGRSEVISSFMLLYFSYQNLTTIYKLALIHLNIGSIVFFWIYLGLGGIYATCSSGQLSNFKWNVLHILSFFGLPYLVRTQFMLVKVLCLSMYMFDIKQIYQSLQILIEEAEEYDVDAIERVLWHQHKRMAQIIQV